MLLTGVAIAAAVLSIAVSLGYVVGIRRGPVLDSPQTRVSVADGEDRVEVPSQSLEELDADKRESLPTLRQSASSSFDAAPKRRSGQAAFESAPKRHDMAADTIESIEPSVVRIEAKGSEAFVGSGFFVSHGRIVTCHHVLEDARTVNVVLANGEELDAIGWVAADPGLDLAVIECRSLAGPAPALSLRRSDRPRKGDTVFALGSPRGFDGSVSSGIVSGFATGSQLLDSLHPNAEFLQTTAAISPGNSGGPLVDSDGLVVAVNCLSRVHSQNLNFALSSRHVSELLSRASHHPQDWDMLPRVKTRRSSTPATAPETTTAVDAIARLEEQQRMNREAEAKRQSAALEAIASQTELSTTSAELANVNQRIARVETDGSALVAERGRVMAAAGGLMQSRNQAWSQHMNLSGELMSLQYSLSRARAQGDAESTMRVNIRVAQVSSSLDNLEQQGRVLSAELTTLDLEARNLLSQINYKHLQRADLLKQQASLKARIEELRGQQGAR